ncbi:uncharacterized protein BDV14DRAFT_203231 [Aspergillus stella-maris]|uniref:uncharacterized protein n=1 Tax=Aspergillus stella-maris TaxID=1810926 RepID=UPI003CCD06E1
MLEADWSPKSSITIFTKDMGIVNETAERLSFPCPIASLALQAFVERAAHGCGQHDNSSVVCNYEDILGQIVAEPEGQKIPPLPAKKAPPTMLDSTTLLGKLDNLPKTLRDSVDVVPFEPGNFN